MAMVRSRHGDDGGDVTGWLAEVDREMVTRWSFVASIQEKVGGQGATLGTVLRASAVPRALWKRLWSGI
jgi:hypothetical protein